MNILRFWYVVDRLCLVTIGVCLLRFDLVDCCVVSLVFLIISSNVSLILFEFYCFRLWLLDYGLLVCYSWLVMLCVDALVVILVIVRNSVVCLGLLDLLLMVVLWLSFVFRCIICCFMFCCVWLVFVCVDFGDLFGFDCAIRRRWMFGLTGLLVWFTLFVLFRWFGLLCWFDFVFGLVGYILIWLIAVWLDVYCDCNSVDWCFAGCLAFFVLLCYLIVWYCVYVLFAGYY